jgi:probable F420-dependent oxidoreductase
MARTAERVGFDSLWVGDHLLYNLPDGTTRGPWEAWTSLAALAAVTEHIEIGPLVASTSFHQPMMLAKQAATIDAISNGRLIVGLGAGWNEREYRAFGLPYDNRVSRFAEAFTIISTLLRDGQLDFHGQYYDADHCIIDPSPVRPGGPPLMVGSTSPRMLSITLPHVDAWNVWWTLYGNTAAGFAATKAEVDAASIAVGRDPSTLAATAAVHVQLDLGRGRLMGHEDGPKVAPIRGSLTEIAEHLAAFAAAGAEHLQLVVDPITDAALEWLGDVLMEFDRITVPR